MKSEMTETIEPSWAAVRSGERYCAPACGLGCTFAEFEEAHRKANAWAEELGEGWVPVVHENLGWHWSVQRGPIKLQNEYRNYPSNRWSTTGTGMFSGNGSTPHIALCDLRHQLEREIERMNKWLENIDAC